MEARESMDEDGGVGGSTGYGLSYHEALEEVLAYVATQRRDPSYAVQQLLPILWPQMTDIAQLEAGRRGLISDANNVIHQQRGAAARGTTTSRGTRGADGKSVRRYPEVVGIHGSEKLRRGLWALVYRVNGVRKPVAEWTAEDFAAFREEHRKIKAGHQRNEDFGELGERLLKQHGVLRAIDLPAKDRKKLEQAARDLRP